jgi:hypothetical protein
MPTPFRPHTQLALESPTNSTYCPPEILASKREDFDKLADKLDFEELQIATQYLANLLLSRVNPILPGPKSLRKDGELYS